MLGPNDRSIVISSNNSLCVIGEAVNFWQPKSEKNHGRLAAKIAKFAV